MNSQWVRAITTLQPANLSNKTNRQFQTCGSELQLRADVRKSMVHASDRLLGFYYKLHAYGVRLIYAKHTLGTKMLADCQVPWILR